MPYIIGGPARGRLTLHAFVTWPRGRMGRGAMWRSGARRGARAARRAAMHIRAVIRRCVIGFDYIFHSIRPNNADLYHSAESPV